jgi:hypothetical protein
MFLVWGSRHLRVQCGHNMSLAYRESNTFNN